MTLARALILNCTMSAALLAGCGRPQPLRSDNANSNEISKTGANGSVGDQAYDFGPVIGQAGQRLTHDYTIINQTGQPITLLRAVNAKPCCGGVEPLGPMVLKSGQSGTLKVTVRLDGKLGPIQHVAMVEAELPDRKILRFSTHANVYPLARIAESDEQTPLGSRSFVASTYASKRAPTVPLDDTTIEATARITWLGPAAEREIAGGIFEQSRAFWLALRDNSEPGYRTEQITLHHNNQSLASYSFQWEIPRRLTVTPSTLLVSSSEGTADKTLC
jgi:hypothetical protein